MLGTLTLGISLVLVAIVQGGTNSAALVREAGATRIVHVGDVVAGARIVAIGADSIRLANGSATYLWSGHSPVADPATDLAALNRINLAKSVTRPASPVVNITLRIPSPLWAFPAYALSVPYFGCSGRRVITVDAAKTFDPLQFAPANLSGPFPNAGGCR